MTRPTDEAGRPCLGPKDWGQLRVNRFQAGWSSESITVAVEDWIVQQLVEDAYRVGLAHGKEDAQ